MRNLKVVGLSLVLGGIITLAGCSFQFQSKPGANTAGEVEEAAGADMEESATTYTVVKGETLWQIAGYDFIYGDTSKWKLIYEANLDILDSPDALKPGQVLIIPRE